MHTRAHGRPISPTPFHYIPWPALGGILWTKLILAWVPKVEIIIRNIYNFLSDLCASGLFIISVAATEFIKAFGLFKLLTGCYKYLYKDHRHTYYSCDVIQKKIICTSVWDKYQFLRAVKVDSGRDRIIIKFLRTQALLSLVRVECTVHIFYLRV